MLTSSLNICLLCRIPQGSLRVQSEKEKYRKKKDKIFLRISKHDLLLCIPICNCEYKLITT
jgi:hypothetical protein